MRIKLNNDMICEETSRSGKLSYTGFLACDSFK